MTIKATALTSGQSTPASVGNGKPYRYRGDAGLDAGRRAPTGSPTSESGPALLREEKAARLSRVRRVPRAGPATPQQAGKLVGVAPKTARSYLSELLEQRRETAPDA